MECGVWSYACHAKRCHVTLETSKNNTSSTRPHVTKCHACHVERTKHSGLNVCENEISFVGQIHLALCRDKGRFVCRPFFFPCRGRDLPFLSALERSLENCGLGSRVPQVIKNGPPCLICWLPNGSNLLVFQPLDRTSWILGVSFNPVTL